MKKSERTFAFFTKDELAEAATFNREQIRALVDFYYNLQDLRIGASNKVSAHERRVDVLRDVAMMAGIKTDMQNLEDKTAEMLETYANNQPLGVWATSIKGVGPKIAAGLLAHIDLTRCCCTNWRHLKGKKRDAIPLHKCPGLSSASCVWNFAGLNPEKQHWGKGEIRPYNKRLKTLCWKIGDQFCKNSVTDEKLNMTVMDIINSIEEECRKKNKPIPSRDALMTTAIKRQKYRERKSDLLDGDEYLYVRLYMARKELEVERNEAGEFREMALRKLDECRRSKRHISENMADTWATGKLQACGLDLRARRYAVKIFLSHYFQVGREITYGDIVKPWIIVHGGHQDYIHPPCWPLDNGRYRKALATNPPTRDEDGWMWNGKEQEDEPKKKRTVKEKINKEKKLVEKDIDREEESAHHRNGHKRTYTTR